LSALPLPEQFRIFAQGAARDGAVTYDAICRGIAEDPDVLALIGEAPVRQRRPNLLLAAVHFLLLGGASHPLAAYYDTVQSMAGRDGAGAGGDPPSLDHVAETFKDFCLSHRTALLELIAVRSTQTNEVGRCTALLPALNVIAAGYPAGQPLSLLDLGTSAGLNLLFDSYAYTYCQRSDGTLVHAGRPEASVRLECTVRGELTGLPSLALPSIATRTGIDAAPIDPTSDDGALWLLACLWPDNLIRFARLREALAVARTTSAPPTVHRGDIIDDLAAVADSIAEEGPLVVFHTWVAAYLSPERQGELVEAIRALAGRRTVHHLYAESPAETPGLPTPPSPSPRPTSSLATALVHLPADGSGPVRLADAHHHGKWLQWWPTPRDPMGHLGEPGPGLLLR
jgi:hypothetical protein